MGSQKKEACVGVELLYEFKARLGECLLKGEPGDGRHTGIICAASLRRVLFNCAPTVVLQSYQAIKGSRIE